MIIHNPILTGSFTVNGTDVASITSSAASIASLNAYTASQNNLNATYATTGSNTLIGTQVVSGSILTSGSITATGTLTAQTLVVQTITSSVDFVTGSTRFGSVVGNTHQFTGSVSVSGSTTLTGALSGTSATFSGAVQTSRIKLIEGTYSTNYTIYTGVDNTNSIGIYNETSGVYNLKIASTGAATFSSSVQTGGNIRTLMTSSTDVPSIYAENNVGSLAQVRVFGTSAGGTLFGVTRAGWSSIDTNNGLGLLFGTTDNAPIVIGTNNTERMRITSGGLVRINTTSTLGGGIFGLNGDIEFGGTAGGNYRITNYQAGFLAFGTDNTERMRITSGGNLLLGTTSSVYSTAAKFEIQYSGASVYGINMRTTTGDAIHLNFVNQSGSQVGYIYSNNTNTQYTTSSDYRLKQDLKEFNGLSLISNIKTYDYEWKSDKSRMYGVIAHELQELLPQAVSGEKDGERMQGVDYSMIVPILVKAIQEQQAQIEILKQEIETLKAN
jgi:hypothetical protein